MTTNANVIEEAVSILIVDDSPTQLEQLKYILEQNSYNVSVANSGRQALAQIGKKIPTLVITDILMPEMSGYELCQKIKEGEKTKGIPVILLTSLSSTEDVLEGLACGADNFISKPYSEQYLLTNIANILVNAKLRKSEYVRLGMEIQFGGKNASSPPISSRC
jgi:PleD family two-component response regulator